MQAGYLILAARALGLDAGPMTGFDAGLDHVQGAKTFNGKTHQVFGQQFISKVEGGKLIRVHATAIEDGLYPDAVDYTTQSF